MLTPPPLPRRHFRYSLSNWIFLGVVVIGWIGIAYFRNPAEPFTARGFGRLIGACLFPTLAAWIAWKTGKRNAKRASLVFNLCFAFLLFGQLSKRGKIGRHSRNLVEQNQKLIAAINDESLDEAGLAEAVANYHQNVQNELLELSENSFGSESKAYAALHRISVDNQQAQLEWDQATSYLVHSELSDPVRVEKRQDAADYRKFFERYVAAAIKYKTHLENTIPRLQAVIDRFQPDATLAKSLIEASKQGHIRESPFTLSALDAQIEFGECSIRWMDFMLDEEANWDFVEETLVFETDELVNQYQSLSMATYAAETRISEAMQILPKTYQEIHSLPENETTISPNN